MLPNGPYFFATTEHSLGHNPIKPTVERTFNVVRIEVEDGIFAKLIQQGHSDVREEDLEIKGVADNCYKYYGCQRAQCGSSDCSDLSVGGGALAELVLGTPLSIGRTEQERRNRYRKAREKPKLTLAKIGYFI